VALVFHANPRALCEGSGGGATSTDAVTLHFTTLRVVDDTQVVRLGGAEAIMTDRRC
jgi:hypothetical protein